MCDDIKTAWNIIYNLDLRNTIYYYYTFYFYILYAKRKSYLLHFSVLTFQYIPQISLYDNVC